MPEVPILPTSVPMCSANRRSSYIRGERAEGCTADGPAAFRAVLTEITRAAGDSDTNGAVAGALAGCYLGYSQLPQVLGDLAAMLHHVPRAGGGEHD